MPVVGVWVQGAGSAAHPLVAAAVLKFSCSRVLPDKVLEADGSFLLVLGQGERLLPHQGLQRAGRPAAWQARPRRSCGLAAAERCAAGPRRELWHQVLRGAGGGRGAAARAHLPLRRSRLRAPEAPAGPVGAQAALAGCSARAQGRQPLQQPQDAARCYQGRADAALAAGAVPAQPRKEPGRGAAAAARVGWQGAWTAAAAAAGRRCRAAAGPAAAQQPCSISGRQWQPGRCRCRQ
jgi:hypothetical protein